ncbi:MAG TPA: NAD(P)/FAD-dependent oxidoreductase, partial [Candidatus Altiarchaeales archaeon]|nr:NAD(P)/FAD-dependent oxidoreductase [Candidatus Altiarchaeales archaeon]
ALRKCKKAGKLGVNAENISIDVDAVFKHVEKTVKISRMGIQKILKDAGVDVLNGFGKLKDKNTVDVDGKEYSAKNIVIATGSKSKTLPGIEIDGEFVLDNAGILALKEIPSDLMIIGAGFIGCEYAGIYSTLGSNVTLVETLPQILPTEDADVVEFIAKKYSSRMELKTSTKLMAIEAKKKTVVLEEEGVRVEYKPSHVLMSVGVAPNTPGIGLEDVGVEFSKAGVKTNDFQRTSVENIYAVGDVCGKQMLAHAAYAQARVAAANICGGKTVYKPNSVPWAVFTSPPIGHAGLTQAEAEKKGKVLVGVAQYASNGKANTMGVRDGFVKTIVDAESGRILGVHIVGSNADTLLGEAQLIVEKEMTADDLLKVIHPHPTLTELIYDSVAGLC